MKGLFFYKLSSPFKEDITRGCKLNICEVDNNFMTLKEASIANMEIDENNKLKLIPYGADEKPIEVDLSQLVASSTLDDLIIEYDSKKGLITFKNQDKILYEVDKLLTSDNTNFNNAFLVTHDNTLIGNGNEISPLRVSPVEETNSYGMVIKLIDTINKGEQLPENPSVGDRYVVYEHYNPFGYLYNYNGVEQILNDIQNTGWRLPSLTEWNNMLNAIDCLPNHGENLFLCNEYFGQDSGQLLKSRNFWKEPQMKSKNGLKRSPNSVVGLDKYNMTILPCGKGTYNRNTYGFSETCEYWTSEGDEDTSDIFTKEFNYNEGGVAQFAKNPNNYYSLRLVKEYDGTNYSPITVINGEEYRTVLLDSYDGNPLIWLGENVKFADEKYMPLNVDVLDETLDVYNIAEWDGTSWLKKTLVDGNVIFFETAPDGKQRREYRLNIDKLEEIKQTSISADDNILTINEDNIIKSNLDILQVNPLCYTLVGNDKKPFTTINFDIPNTIKNVELVMPATEEDNINDNTVIVGKNYLKFSFVNGGYEEVNLKPIYIPLENIIEPYKYKAGNGILIDENNNISVKLNENKSNMLELDENGLNLNKIDFNFIEE